MSQEGTIRHLMDTARSCDGALRHAMPAIVYKAWVGELLDPLPQPVAQGEVQTVIGSLKWLHYYHPDHPGLVLNDADSPTGLSVNPNVLLTVLGTPYDGELNNIFQPETALAQMWTLVRLDFADWEKMTGFLVPTPSGLQLMQLVRSLDLKLDA